MSETSPSAGHRSPVVYFIDDSATMREVIKIAFRKEAIHVIACHNAASAIEQFEQTPPDAVITDVIMPDKDGYEVCQYVKSHPQFSSAPVILMSGVVNRSVAERAMAVKADELMRKPFQPGDLIARVRGLLNPQVATPPAKFTGAEGGGSAAATLSHLFGAPAPAPPAVRPLVGAAQQRVPALAGRTAVPLNAAFGTPGAPTSSPAAPQTDVLKLQNEIRRLEMLVKKLRAELEAEREYRAALETQLQTSHEMG